MRVVKHTVWHHLLMIFYSELINILWFFTSVALLVAGLAVFKFVHYEFYRLVIGLPVLIIGISVSIFKLYEMILVIFNPKRLQSICIFCRDSKDWKNDPRKKGKLITKSSFGRSCFGCEKGSPSSCFYAFQYILTSLHFLFSRRHSTDS